MLHAEGIFCSLFPNTKANIKKTSPKHVYIQKGVVFMCVTRYKKSVDGQALGGFIAEDLDFKLSSFQLWVLVVVINKFKYLITPWPLYGIIVVYENCHT